MANMIDKKPDYEGEKKVWESFAQNLPSEVIVYNNREINGREFDFCLLMKNVGIIIIEVKGWNADSIFDVAGVDNIIISGYDKPQKSPKKQARAYRFGLLNMINERYNVSPLIFDLVCYPFISEKQYYEKRLDIVSEKSFTLFKEDLLDSIRMGNKILNAFDQYKAIPHTEMDEPLIGKIRQYFEPDFNTSKSINVNNKSPYSITIMCLDKMKKKDIHKIIEQYLLGIKIFIFVNNFDIAESILYILEGELDERGITVDKNNLKMVNDACNDFSVTKNCFRIFNFELYVVEDISTIINKDIVLYEGQTNLEEKQILYKISEKCSFNVQQYFIEHAPGNKNILVKAGAGTGKTYSMVSRISYLCNKYENPIVNTIDDIAMVTFTNDAADNMKKRLKQMFINYFALTRDPKYLKYIENVDFMRISTIHKFAREIIQGYSMQIGLGENFAITSGDFIKEQIYEKYLNSFIANKEKDNPNFMAEIKLPLYEFKHMLVEFSNQLYNKSIDIKRIKADELGEPPKLMPFFNEVIMDVIIAAEKEYEEKIQALNKMDLRETMILLNDIVNKYNKGKINFNYSYIFIDEFQDTDDAQIDSFMKIQKSIGNDCKLFVVGDLKQSIYRFRGATISAFDQLSTTSDKWEEHTINTNYRTDSRLLNIYDEIFKKMGDNNKLPYAFEKDHLVSRIYSGMKEDALFYCVPYKEQDDQMNKLVEVLKNEKARLIDMEKDKKLSKEEKTIAILVRENWQIDKIIKECKKIDNSIDIQTKIGGDLYQLDSSMDFCKLLLALTYSMEPIYLVNFIESNYVKIPVGYQGLQNISKEQQYELLRRILDEYLNCKIGKTWEELVRYVKTKPILVVLRELFEALHPWKQYSNNIEKQRFYKSNYELLLEKIIKAYSIDYLTLNTITEAIQINILTRQHEQSRNNIYQNDEITFLCTTVHKSKGLEYGTVILPFTNEAIDNLKKANTDVLYSKARLAYSIKIEKNKRDTNSYYDFKEEIEQRVCEEARILYVALTRAIHNFVWMKDITSTNDICWEKFLEE